ncbi:hypothetical protein Tsubulata_018037 [Turnera subulata]|uniref:THH1/TOM1/TOM3 domain-containing protein n=1 Tax=Turnera subulata TaxID=218843 RepID=A0A9Q0J4W8_9ROSI|nr:hypothetical protein Tsubulata_018037 [Turnera subulata]
MFGRSSRFPREVVGVNAGLALVDVIIALFAFSQLIRIHSRNSQLGWTRQKVFHLLIGTSNLGFFVYFVTTVIATYKGWICWSYSCGFVLMAFPRILLFAAFLLLLSFWVDLCHQADDEDYEEEDFSFRESFLETRSTDPYSTHADNHRICLPLRSIHIGSRQKIVILVNLLAFALMVTFAVLIGIGIGDNFIDSSFLAKVYVDAFAAAMLLLGGALACYGLQLCLKIRRVRYDRAASEMWKVAGLAIVSVLCFSSSAFVAFFTNIPVLYHCQQLHNKGVYVSLLLILYHFIGSSIPSAFVLWIMGELPPSRTANAHEESSRIAFISDSSAAVENPQRWTTVTSLQNQVFMSFLLLICIHHDLYRNTYFADSGFVLPITYIFELVCAMSNSYGL